MLIENLEISSFCNANCPWCGRNKMSRKNQHISLALVDKVAQKISGKQNNINLHLWGEPLLHPQLPEIILILKSYGVNSSFFTNGISLTEKMIIELSKLPIRQLCITVNIYAPMDMVKKCWEKCDFLVEAVYLTDMPYKSKISKKNFTKFCNENGKEPRFLKYENPYSKKQNFCFYKDCEKCEIKKQNKCFVLVDGTVVSCVKDFEGVTKIGHIDNFDKIKYSNIKCDYD